MNHLVYFDDQQFVPLGHPGEERELKPFGTTLLTAASEGRLFYCTYCVCRDCKSIGTTRALSLPTMLMDTTKPGWMKSMLVATGAIALSIVLGWPPFLWIVPLLLYVLLDDWLRTFRRRRRARRLSRERQALAPSDAHEASSCSRCGSSRLVGYLTYVLDARAKGQSADATVRCPKCHALAFRHDEAFMMVA